MALKDKLKELRLERGFTQEAVAEYLNISAQTVSKWERGLLSPDIMLLPKLAVLYRCSIDSIFDMESSWSEEHQKEFEAKIRELHTKKDFEGEYREWIREIEVKPDNFANYTDIMLLVERQAMFDDAHVRRMLQLAAHAENYCFDDDIRNEIYRSMIKICSNSETPDIKAKADYYYKKLPMLRHSREVYARYVMNDEQYREQTKKNIIYTIDLCECAIRQLITKEMNAEEKLFYYLKAAALYETVLDDKYGGFYDVPLVCDYAEIAALYVQLGEDALAESYIKRIFSVMGKHFKETKEKSTLLYATKIPNTTPASKSCLKLLNSMIKNPYLEHFKNEIECIKNNYSAFD